ncbi:MULTISPECIES: response regulator [unclassified Halomonas]|uniref:Response regulator n=2 Tax=unclassified Halomonas TaxID=2609666 RepID=A0AAU7KMP6_9GAMM|nr:MULTISPECIES: response regulator [unclassified Halomonas]MBR9771990.1 response regulator [Gammaproteobacteria bacterium]MCJ8286282.1 response regulator [Halomonas sp.]NQY72676.1 response regulator [Halomonas sp.]RQW72470.1 response regulator [Halomonas sp. YLB-10]
MRILFIEDDDILGDGLSEGLSLLGHQVDWLTRGDTAAHALADNAFDAVILDLSLPGFTGMELLRRWRDEGFREPILVLTADEDTRRCVEALNEGADDYITKPIDLDELDARLKALLRRARGHADNLLECGDIRLDRSDRLAWLGGEPLDLSAYEYVVLESLLERPGRVVARSQLEARLYGWDDGPDSNSLSVLIHKLRSKLGDHRIETLRGLGYRVSP